MSSLIRRLAIGAAALLGVAALAGQAAAQNCGITSISNSVTTINYDPFNPTAITGASGTMTINRVTGGGGAKTQSARVYATLPSGSPAYQLSFIDGGEVDVLNSGQNVVWIGSTPPTPSINGPPPSGVAGLDFQGVAQPNTANVTYNISIPAGLDLTSGQSITFGLNYVCKGTGGLGDVTSVQTVPQGIVLNINVLSALQASLAGGPLTFGEIGDEDNITCCTPTHFSNTANVTVRSSGPYSVDVASANNYQLRLNPGGTAGNPLHEVPYQLHFLGQTANPGATNYPLRNCARAGVSGGVVHQINARLLGGGQGDVPGAYSDTLTITVTPLAAAPAHSACPVAP